MAKLEYYIPQVLGQRAVVNEFADLLTKTFGGCTILTDCRGLWRNDKDEIIRDDIAIVQVITSDYLAIQKQNEIEVLLAEIAVKLNQECILWTSQTWVTSHYVTPTKAS